MRPPILTIEIASEVKPFRMLRKLYGWVAGVGAVLALAFAAMVGKTPDLWGLTFALGLVVALTLPLPWVLPLLVVAPFRIHRYSARFDRASGRFDLAHARLLGATVAEGALDDIERVEPFLMRGKYGTTAGVSLVLKDGTRHDIYKESGMFPPPAKGPRTAVVEDLAERIGAYLAPSDPTNN